MTCIIIDDEPLAREGMELLVNQREDLKLIATFNGVKKAVAFLENNQVDLIFLDIQMPGITGIEFAATVSPKTLVVFATAYEQYAFQSYELDAVDYLLKPITEERFEKAVSKAINYHKLLTSKTAESVIEDVTNDFILIKADRKFHKVPFAEILYIEGLKDYVVIFINDTKIITAMNVKTINSKLPPDVFLRVSKSYIINKNHIKSFDTHQIYLDKTTIPLGESYRKPFLDFFLNSTTSDNP